MDEPTPKIQSRLSNTGAITLILPALFFVLVLSAALAKIIVDWEKLRVDSLEMIAIMLAIALFLLLTSWYGYYKIAVENGQVKLKGFFRQETFSLNQITGYALTSLPMNRGGRLDALHLGLPEGRFVSVFPLYYRNYVDLKAVLTQGKLPDPSLAAQATRFQKWQEFVTYAFILFIATFMIIAYLDSPNAEKEMGDNKWLILAGISFAFIYLCWKFWQYRKLPRH